ncbi:uncharacterized protein LOC143233311 [Tachypleus tridentatus]|uniref:uncharacterized protein LOC143233311 n=1 Tax=Tachypleus tridentatus TaxID=6853 RepID=UPI003FD14764
MFTCEEELCCPEDDWSPPSPVDEDIVGNKSVNLTGAMDSSDKIQHSPKTACSHPCGSNAIGEPWRENDFRYTQVMDRTKRQILFEKLQKYAESWSLSEPETKTSERFYDVDSGSDSVEELDLNGRKDESEILRIYEGREYERNVDVSSKSANENTLTSLQRVLENPSHDCTVSLVSINKMTTNSASMGDSGMTSPTSVELETCNGLNKRNLTHDDIAFGGKEGESSHLTDCRCRLAQDTNDHGGKEGESSHLTDCSCRLAQDTNDDGGKEGESSHLTDCSCILAQDTNDHGGKESESSHLTDCSCRLAQDTNDHGGKEGESLGFTDSSCRLAQNTNDHGGKEGESSHLIDSSCRLAQDTNDHGGKESESLGFTDSSCRLAQDTNDHGGKKSESSDLTDSNCRLAQDTNNNGGKEGESSDLIDSSCRLAQDTNDGVEEYDKDLDENTTESLYTREETKKSLYISVDESVQTSDPDSLNRLLEESSQNENPVTDSKYKSEGVESKWNVLNGLEKKEDGDKKLIRSTSLKTGKTPPGTPSRKKIVCFADTLGLDLEAVRHIGSEDEDLDIPASAFSDLNISSSGRSSINLISQNNPFAYSFDMHTSSNNSRTFIPLFPQPMTQNDFMDRIRNQKVCLENIIASGLNVQCYVRVLNISFEKLVVARYTTNEWLSYDDVLANYVHGSYDGLSDKFSWNFFVPFMSEGQRLIFAIRFLANGQEFWDNNDGKNYILRCHSQSSGVSGPLTEGSSPWMHRFM